MSSSFDLKKLGWNSFFAESFAPYAAEGFTAGRVVLQHNKIYDLYTPEGEAQAEATGRLRHRAEGPQDLPAVGDWVVARPRRETEELLRIHEVLPRKSKFSRRAAGNRDEEQVVAANVDTVFLVTGLDEDYNPRRIERYLIMAYESGARPVVLLNKADLCANAEERARETEEIAAGASVVVLSAKRDEQLSQLEPFIGPGETVALLGSSGVGKSTIVNRLAGEDLQRTSEVRSSDSRGKHTTTHRELILLPNGGIVIDTPGMRELQLLVSDRGLRETFDDVEKIALSCRFTDCRHESEPGCAIREALDAGALDAQRYENYRKTLAEMEELSARQSARLAQDERKERGKRIARNIRQAQKRR